MAFFTRTDPAKNLHRFYVMHLAPTLFGDWSLLREWGRSGSPGRVRCDTFDSEQQARDAARRIRRTRERHGYMLHP